MVDLRSQAPQASGFGPNEWLIDELYARYLADKSSVDKAWWDFFADYKPEGASSGEGGEAKAAVPTSPEVTIAAAAAAPASVKAAATAKAKAAATTPTAPQAPAAPSGPQSQPQASAPTTSPSTGTAEIPIVRAQPAVADYASSPGEAMIAAAHGGNDTEEVLRGAAARVVTNMTASLEIPTATSVRTIPAKLLIDNRSLINHQLDRVYGGRVSFTHLIGYAIVEALITMPEMNTTFAQAEGKPAAVHRGHVNLGLAIDVERAGGGRQLLVPNVSAAEEMEFAQFWARYEDIVRRARTGQLKPEDFAGTTATLTNPGGLGTVHSVPRLMPQQGVIIGVGSMDFPAEYAGATDEVISGAAISKVLTLTSTYDHRVIQGAQSGEFLRLIHKKLIGEDGFYDRVFESLRIPYQPYRWQRDKPADPAVKTAHVFELIHAYRDRGHMMADTDPLAFRQRGHEDLDLASHELSIWDLERTFPVDGLGGAETLTLRQILTVLREAYCRTIGVEYMHIADSRQRTWFQEHLERPRPKLSRDEQLRILRRLNQAEAFETFLQTKYVGQKRFSLEGAESVIPLLDSVISAAADASIPEVGIGMAHRGRLNVLVNIAGKSYGQVFSEFEGNEDPKSVQGGGDVKYHLGTEGTFTSASGAQTKVHLAANPSHLEAVDGVLEGIVRAKQDRLGIPRTFGALPILLHGDAAFAGQGVVAETLNLSMLRGYHTGGTVHVIINNQVGFTTGTSHSRSTYYCSDVAKGFGMPVFHVNGDDPEACLHVARLAFEYRQEFGRDAVIDMVCYRRRGHNEGDDPSMTQPVMYSLIEQKRSVRKLYTESLVSRQDITIEDAEEALRHYQGELEKVFTETRAAGKAPAATDEEATKGLERPEAQQEDAGVMVGWRSAVEPNVLLKVGKAYTRPPADFSMHPKLQAVVDKRFDMSTKGNIDWGYAEILAFGSLLMEGTPVRLTGQDSRRGTFVSRHATLHDQVTGAEWTPLSYLSRDQAPFWIYDSSLSEYAVMAFEYGYSLERPDALVLWEAQFGDFAIGAQTIIDEFVSAAEQKWQQHSSVVLLLPHGFEGQGADHSSARIERYLQLCARDNMIVAQPSAPSNYFHLLRKQAYARPRKPLIVFTPKSMLRAKAAVSPVEEFTSGEFRPVIGEAEVPVASADLVLMCSGKLYWELVAERAKRGEQNTAIVRLEQLYPRPADELRAALADLPDGTRLRWVQDEPANQGPWPDVRDWVPAAIGRAVEVASRPESAAPATGSHVAHDMERADLLAAAFAR